MILQRAKILFPLLLVIVSVSAQKLKKADKITVANLRNHIYYLADDKLEGRRAGSNGERLAMEYISGQFRSMGLLPKGTNEYYQPFEINEGKRINEGTYLKINDDDLEPGKDFFPLPFSPNKKVEGSPAIAVQEADLPWFVDLSEAVDENKTAVILYNTSNTDDRLVFNGRDKTELSPVPVIYVSKQAAKKYFQDKTASMDIRLRTDIGEHKRTGHNVVGYIDNGASTTVILGAHFDHLGYGEDGNSMLRTGEKLIHNGADDNASGTAALIELARILKSSRAKHNNYLFIAFSGEELGLFGSKYFAEHPTIEISSVNYMINMDMVGRLNDSTKVLSIGGYGTSPEWASVIKPAMKNPPFFIKLDSSGTGPSDHTSFYRKDIPVLFFFTGQHKDYHRPTDDADKINYTGELKVVNYIYGIITAVNSEDHKLAFLKTKETENRVTALRVTLGIMPDYTYDGTGIRADGVTEGRPAFKAGIKSGDIIIQLGDYPVNSMDTYMQALGKFSKGDKTKVKFKRGQEIIESPIEF
jgi:Zn-dependent M28 family amino/carboxypeptidase